jgi:hypothetical protein
VDWDAAATSRAAALNLVREAVGSVVRPVVANSMVDPVAIRIVVVATSSSVDSSVVVAVEQSEVVVVATSRAGSITETKCYTLLPTLSLGILRYFLLFLR